MAVKTRGYMSVNQIVELRRPGLTVWAYRRNKYLGRVEINQAGLAAFTGKKGGKRLGNMSWASLFDRLDRRK
jgi:hypothetical protein